MIKLKGQLVLVSESPQRARLLGLLNTDFSIVSPIGDEIYDDGLSHQEQIEAIALRKALSVKDYFPGDILIAADTVIVHNGEVLGKPKDETDAFNMLKKLSGNTHQVITGVCLMSENLTDVFSVITNVSLYPMSDQEIDYYVASGESMGRSGSYAIQGGMSLFVRDIQGDINSVVGLPITEVYRRLRDRF